MHNLKGYAEMRVESSEREIVPARVVPVPDTEGGGFMVGPVRASYVFLKKPKEEKIDGQPVRMKYSLVGLLPPGSDFKTLWDASEALIRANLGEKLRNIPGQKIPDQIKRGIRFVDREVGYQGKQGFHPGWGFISFITYDNCPGVVNAQRETIDPGLVIPGYWVRIRTKPFFYSNKQVGVSWGLNAVQLGYSDKRLDNRVEAGQAFSEWEVDATGMDSAGVPGGVPAGTYGSMNTPEKNLWD